MLRFALVLTTTLLFTASPVRAQMAIAPPNACTERSDVLSHLSDKYSEAPVAMGIANNGGVIEILSSQAGKSWTIILTMPNGVGLHDRGWRKLGSAAGDLPPGPLPPESPTGGIFRQAGIICRMRGE